MSREADYDKSFDANAKAAFFFIQQAGRTMADSGSIVTLVSSLLAAYTPFYAIYPGSKAAVEHYTRAASKEFGERGISVNAIGPGPMDAPFFYGQKSKEAVDHTSSAAALGKFSKTGLTDIEDIAPIVRFLVTEGWWITGQTISANGGYTHADPARCRLEDERHATIMVMGGGFVLLVVFLQAARFMGDGSSAALAVAAKWFIPAWFIGAGINMAVGVIKAGYSVAEELPIFLLIFAVPAVVARLLW